MRKNVLALLLVLAIISGCAKPDVVEPGLSISPEYQGFTAEKESSGNVGLALYLVSDGNAVSGEFMLDFLTGISQVFGKLDGDLRNGVLTLHLRVPPYYIREYGLSPTLEMKLEGQSCTQAEALEILGIRGRESDLQVVADQKLSGRLKYSAFQKDYDLPVHLVNQPTQGNLFNK